MSVMRAALLLVSSLASGSRVEVQANGNTNEPALHAGTMIGIMAAMPDEIVKLKQHVTDQEEHKRGSVFTFTTGKLGGRPVVVAPANVRLPLV